MICQPEHPLYRSMLKNRSDDLPRLVFADWLEEQGDSDRANLIRSQCVEADSAADPVARLHARLTQNALLERFAASWRAEEMPATTTIEPGDYQRGFVDTVTVLANQPMDDAAVEYLANWPVTCLDLRHLEVRDWNSIPKRVRETMPRCPALTLSPRPFTAGSLTKIAEGIRDWVQSLTLALNRPGMVYADELVGFHKLRSLNVSLTNLADVRMPGLCRADLPLSQFSAVGCRLTPQVLTHLLGSPWMSRLTELNLNNNIFRQTSAVQFPETAGQLAVVNLRSCMLDALSITPWLEFPAMQPVRVLTLECNPLGPSGFHALCERFAAGALHTLKINDCSLADPEMSILRRAPLARHLRSLSITDNDLRNGQFAFLEDWLAHGQLQILHADRNPLGQRDLDVIFPTQSPLPWVELSLSECGLRAEMLERLSQVHSAPHLLGLNLHGNRIQNGGLLHLLDSPIVSNLQVLNLSNTGITEVGIQAILDCPRLPQRFTHLALRGAIHSNSSSHERWLNRLRQRFGPNVYL
ncbi:TIGR02996 domain-containing protein [Tuwongella immobilis]|uniref:Repeat-companion domain protein n=1 Tax=Tuwongella immobilis TaxID=692036 RepID=A0A6C2YIK9_9BACT|nr:TIGR02996 domain-containing protein [Tuwongella immobilis]VIP01246.1 Repeat-companion domain protein OS=Isosphaera pallida (strain ATCC 43644 / DSM 9630 / IS1B) GN=Isop_0482 PE=4 SV=1: LRR_6 [Tuwongella immobilis]VTR97918.1 Repeat-companion domain protein OS=Isosphaera pallida (strain ATCC 43644 / DSM 9630 / IS1B) GN=Isop_0482 PE=4 SV=1: LRR_6 [Tuwongella immobilis]